MYATSAKKTLHKPYSMIRGGNLSNLLKLEGVVVYFLSSEEVILTRRQVQRGKIYFSLKRKKRR